MHSSILTMAVLFLYIISLPQTGLKTLTNQPTIAPAGIILSVKFGSGKPTAAEWRYPALCIPRYRTPVGIHTFISLTSCVLMPLLHTSDLCNLAAVDHHTEKSNGESDRRLGHPWCHVSLSLSSFSSSFVLRCFLPLLSSLAYSTPVTCLLFSFLPLLVPLFILYVWLPLFSSLSLPLLSLSLLSLSLHT